MKSYLFAALSAAVAISTTQAQGDMKDQEKCYGIAKAGQNGCATEAHTCAGKSEKDNDKKEWMDVKTGECKEKGGSLTPG
jgi:uncharacterized membrane protein